MGNRLIPSIPGDTPLLGAMRPGRLSLRSILLIIGFGLLILVPGSLPLSRTITSHEQLAAQPAREMLADGHWIIPTINNVARLEKPPTTSWLIAASMAVFHTDSAWAVRVPSTLSAILCSLLIAALAARWLGNFVGLLAGLIQLSTVWVQTQAHLAEADMPLTAAVTLAFALFALGNVSVDDILDVKPQIANRPALARLFLVATGIAFLFKGPVALLFIFAGCLAFILLTGRWRSLRFIFDPIGLAMMLLIIAAWPIAAMRAYPPITAIWYQETFGYTTSSTFGGKPWHTYLGSIPLSLLPWTLLLVPLAIAAWNTRRYRSPFALFLLAWCAPGLIILQGMSFKSAHYTYPLLPPFSIALAAGLVVWLRWQYTRPLLNRMASSIALVAIAAGASILLSQAHLPLSPAIPIAVVMVASMGILIVLWLEERRKLAAELTVLFLTLAAGVVMGDLLIIPRIPLNRARFAFANEINAIVPAGVPLPLVGFGTDEISWYLRQPLLRIDNLNDFVQQQPIATPTYVVTRKKALDDLAQRFNVEIVDTIALPSNADLEDQQGKQPYLVRISPKAR